MKRNKHTCCCSIESHD